MRCDIQMLAFVLGLICLQLNGAELRPTFRGTSSINVEIEYPVVIADASDLYSFQFDVSYDPAVLQLESITEGRFLHTAGTTVFVPGTFDNNSGTATLIAGSVVGPVSGASGEGVLADLLFRSAGFGSTRVTLSNVILLDSSLNDIVFTSLPGNVWVVLVPPRPVPEPATRWLAGSMIAVVMFWSRRRKVS